MQNIINQNIIEFFNNFFAKENNTVINKKIIEINDYIEITIHGICNSTLSISTEYNELTIEFGQSHWHHDYNNENEITELIQSVKDDIDNIFNGNTATYSIHCNGDIRGGGSINTKNLSMETFKKLWGNNINYVQISIWGKPSFNMENAQQGDAPEPATMISPASQHHIGRPGDL